VKLGTGRIAGMIKGGAVNLPPEWQNAEVRWVYVIETERTLVLAFTNGKVLQVGPLDDVETLRPGQPARIGVQFGTMTEPIEPPPNSNPALTGFVVAQKLHAIRMEGGHLWIELEDGRRGLVVAPSGIATWTAPPRPPEAVQ
jgi:hypothetical protein